MAVAILISLIFQNYLGFTTKFSELFQSNGRFSNRAILAFCTYLGLFYFFPIPLIYFLTFNFIADMILGNLDSIDDKLKIKVSFISFQTSLFLVFVPNYFNQNFFSNGSFGEILVLAIATLFFTFNVLRSPLERTKKLFLFFFVLIGLGFGIHSIFYSFSGELFFPTIYEVALLSSLLILGYDSIQSIWFRILKIGVLIFITTIIFSNFSIPAEEASFLKWTNSYFCMALIFWSLAAKNSSSLLSQFINGRSSFKANLKNTLMHPFVDRTFALIACWPFLMRLASAINRPVIDFPLIALYLNLLSLIVPMLFRARAKDVTINLWVWMISFFATYWPLLLRPIGSKGISLVDENVSLFLTVISLAVNLYARFSLGRSIGFVPANRGIVTSGAYKWVRHPIYSAVLINFFVVVMTRYDLANLFIYSTQLGLFYYKAKLEEDLLIEDPEYLAYTKRVKYRLIPGVI